MQCTFVPSDFLPDCEGAGLPEKWIRGGGGGEGLTV